MCLVSATKSLPVCRPSVAGYKGIQVDRDINECRRDTVNMYPERRHVSVDIYSMYPDTSCSSGIHVSGRHVSSCKRGISYQKCEDIIIIIIIIIKNEKIKVTLCENAAGALYIVS